MVSASFTCNFMLQYILVLPFDDPATTISIEDNSNLIGTGDSVNVTWNESALTEGILHDYTVAVNITIVSSSIFCIFTLVNINRCSIILTLISGKVQKH